MATEAEIQKAVKKLRAELERNAPAIAQILSASETECSDPRCSHFQIHAWCPDKIREA